MGFAADNTAYCSAAPVDNTAGTYHTRQSRRARRRALELHVAKCELREQEQEAKLHSFTSLDVGLLQAAVLRMSISQTVHNQRGQERTFKSPEKESRLLLAKVYRELRKCTFLGHGKMNCFGFGSAAFLAQKRQADASAKRVAVEKELEGKWCAVIPTIPEKQSNFPENAENRTALATLQRQQIEQRLCMRLQLYETQDDESFVVEANEHTFQNESLPEGAINVAKSEVEEICLAIDDINRNRKRDTWKNQAAWSEFKDLMQTIRQINMI